MDFSKIFDNVPNNQTKTPAKEPDETQTPEPKPEPKKKLTIETEVLEEVPEGVKPFGSFSYLSDDGSEEIEGQIGLTLNENNELKATIYREKRTEAFNETMKNNPKTASRIKEVTERSILKIAEFVTIYHKDPEIYDFFFKKENEIEALKFIESLTPEDYSLLDLDADTIKAIEAAEGENKLLAFLEIFDSPVDQRIPEFFKAVMANRGESILVKTPEKFIYTLDNLTKGVFNGKIKIDGETYPVKVKKANEEKGIEEKNITARLYYPDENKAIESLSLFDKCVYDAINTEFEDAENETTTIAKIYRTMTGKKSDKQKPSERMYKAILSSVIKMSCIMVILNKQTLTEWGVGTKFKTRRLLPVEIEGCKVNGVYVEDAVTKVGDLPLYEFADQLNQIQRTPLEVLDTPIRKDKERIMLQRYLYERVLQAKSTGDKKIVLDSIYKAIGLNLGNDKKSRNKKTKLLTDIEELLTYWAKEEIRDINPKGAIYGYEIHKKSTANYSIELYLTKKDKDKAAKRRKAAKNK